MPNFICPKCHTSLFWDGQSPIVQCSSCATRYRMHVRTVSDIQTTQGRYKGRALVKSFIPKGWSTETNAPEQNSNVLCPLTVQVAYSSPAQDSFITFTGTQAFSHLEPTPQNANLQGQLILPDRIIGLAFRDANAVCDGILTQNPSLSDVRILSSMEKPDAWAANHQQHILQGFAQGGLQNPQGTWAKKYVTVRDQKGQVWHKLVEAMVNWGYVPVSQAELMMYQIVQQRQARTMGLMGMNQQPIQPPQPKLRWAIQYIIETSAKEQSFPAAMEAHERIRDTIEVLPLFEQERERITQYLLMQIQQDNDAFGRMAQDQMNSWERRQQIMKDASDYGNNVMREMRESNSQTSQRINNLRSESIRGVNTYYTHSSGYGVPPVVEASTQWDHVYQSSQNPERFAASTGEAPLEFGVDFEELKGTGGDY